MESLIEVAPLPPVPRHDLLTYLVPDTLRDRLQPGMRVRVPLGRQTRTGVVAGYTSSPPPGELRSVLGLLDADPFLSLELLELCRWAARYYLTSLAEVISTVVPTVLPHQPTERWLRLTPAGITAAEAGGKRRERARRRALQLLLAAPERELPITSLRSVGVSAATLRGLLAVNSVEALTRTPTRVELPASQIPRPVLTAAQEQAVTSIAAGLTTDPPPSFLLHGITGSGKTEVFLATAEQTLAGGRSVLLLVPEIALTHQLVERVQARFGATVAVLHSGLNPRERWSEWRRILSGSARVVVGARSAVFAPLQQLGLVVVDEEHDPAYKQEEGLRYNARDLAVVRARLAQAVCVLASATPSAEGYHAARDGRHVLLELPERPTAHPLPTVELVDLRRRARSAGKDSGLVSHDLRAAMAANLGRSGQTLVFLNRRGFANYLQCPACGETASCPHCSVTLTWHRAAGALVCHHCHYRRRPPAACPACRGPALEAFGVGTEQVESALRREFPLAVVERLDRDAAQRAGAQQRILGEWRAGETDILVGTQMVSKGHDAPGVTLVVVLLADQSLNVPDFRAGERTFQLLVQVAGRAGRGDAAGHVLVQTFRPQHPSLAACVTHDYRSFMEGELARRRTLGYPPFSRLVNLRLDGMDESAVERAARGLAAELRREAQRLTLGDDTILGPAPAPIARVRGRHRWQVLLRHRDVPALRGLARLALARAPRGKPAVRLIIDVDPYSML